MITVIVLMRTMLFMLFMLSYLFFFVISLKVLIISNNFHQWQHVSAANTAIDAACILINMSLLLVLLISACSIYIPLPSHPFPSTALPLLTLPLYSPPLSFFLPSSFLNGLHGIRKMMSYYINCFKKMHLVYLYFFIRMVHM